MLRRLAVVLICSGILFGQKYTGPQPEKADLPYLVHADNLTATEAGEAKEQDRKGDHIAVIPGATSSAATPLNSPIFIIRADKINPDQLEVFRLESKNGNREVILTHKGKPVAKPVISTVTKVGDDLYKLEVNQDLPNGEYSISPQGSNTVFCFRVY
ncbi:MAG TPA: hypothetical protein VK335_03395 [Bryobacteraceae bacterium]|nr:hypothetical protein [Bryobacteraceae bacterium]